MTCRELSDFLDPYRNGDFAAGTSRHFAEHLRRCRACSAYRQTYEATIRLASVACSEASPGSEEMPESLVASILTHARGPSTRSPIPVRQFLD